MRNLLLFFIIMILMNGCNIGKTASNSPYGAYGPTNVNIAGCLTINGGNTAYLFFTVYNTNPTAYIDIYKVSESSISIQYSGNCDINNSSHNPICNLTLSGMMESNVLNIQARLNGTNGPSNTVFSASIPKCQN